MMLSIRVALLMLPLASSFVPLPSSPVHRYPPLSFQLQAEFSSEDPNNLDPLASRIRREVLNEEETLLRIHCSSNYDDLDQVLQRVQDYIMAFPFDRVLPIQQVDCLATINNGVELIFRRDHDQSQDGGLAFHLVPDNNEDTTAGFELQIQRIPQGQTCRKTTTEKLVVRAFVQGFGGQVEYRTKWKTNNEDPPPTDHLVGMQSLFHKWMMAP